MAIDADLLLRIRQIWEAARVQAARSVNTTHVVANWLIGQQIVEAEQGGSGRAEYGTALLRGLSRQLSRDVGSGFSISALQYMRAFYLTYPGLLYQDQTSHVTDDPSLAEVAHDFQHALRVVSAANVGHDWHPGQIHSALSWTHYRALLKVNRREARDFYEIEAVRNGWSARQLERQINSLLFERLLKSQDKDGILALARAGLVARAPIDVVKDPYVLEFLDLPESHRLVESQLEAALISQLQDFLLELGSGFAFIGRQVRLTLDGDHFYPDLVFYHVKLKCYVVIDLKVGKLSHGDLGQMQMYVHFYDQEVVETGDNPTIGLVLCTDKNDAVVRYVLGDDARQISASGYLLQLPSEETLRAELRRELERLDPPTTGC